MMWGSHIISGKKLIPYLGWYNALTRIFHKIKNERRREDSKQNSQTRI